MLANGIFDAPIPGQSLTQHPGASPIEHPPRFVHIDEALEFTWGQFHKKKSMIKLFMLLKAGMPAESICRTILYQGLMKSYWTVDLALLMFQTVLWQIEAMAKLKGIKVQTFNNDPDYNNFLLHTDQLMQQNSEQQDMLEDFKDNGSDEAQEEQPKAFKGFF